MSFFLDYVNSTGDLDLLCRSPWGVANKNSTQSSDLPSWCPDFFEPEYSNILFAQRGIFSAGKKHCRVPCIISDKSRLHLEGTVLGSITSVQHRTANGTWCSEYEYAARNMPRQLQAEGIHADPCVYRHKDESAFQAYWRTLLADCEIYPTRRMDHSVLQIHSTIFSELQQEEKGDTASKMAVQNVSMLQKMLGSFSFGIVHDDVYCMVPHTAQLGDVLAILDGAKVPMVLRPLRSEALHVPEMLCYTVVGTAYVHGFMDGQAARLATEHALEETTLVLV